MRLSTGNDSFAVGVTFDDVGRPKTTRYPQPLGQEPFTITREYDAHGFVVGVRETNSSDSYWQLTDVDQAGRYKEESFGNQTKTVRTYFDDKQALKSISTTLGNSTIQQLSYGWDQRLNLKSRTDTLQATNKTEWLRHDELDRLTCAYFATTESPGATCATAYGYAPNGNLTSKSDIGTLSYTDPNHPHAVTNAPGSVFTYDAAGNQIGRPGGVTITYTPFDLPETIKKNGKTTSFGYDGDQQRIRKTSTTSETLYVDDLFEQVTSGNAKEFRYYVHSPERLIAVVTRASANAGTNYLHTDHLGSIESVTNASGIVVEKRSYDAFGAKRNPQWGMSGGLTSGLVAKGFTGHEEEDEFGLINMKGRLFDPKIARFTTTDPVISNVWDGQTINPFSYVHNNPLAFVDPTGFVDREVFPYQDMIQQVVKVVYPDDFVPDPLPEEIRESTNSMRATTDVGTTGDGAEGQSGGDVMRDVLGGVASGYAGDVIETAKGIALLTFFPPAFFAMKGYNFWDGVFRGGAEGYAQDGAFGAFAGAINSFNPFAHVGLALAGTVDSAEKGDYKQAGEQGYRAAVGIAGIAAAVLGVAVGSGGGRGTIWDPGGAATGKVPSSWGSGAATKKGVGIRWTDPKNEGNGIRIDAGNPANTQVTQKVDHVIVRHNGQVIGRNGAPINGDIKTNAIDAHIPLSEWLTWSNWFSP